MTKCPYCEYETPEPDDGNDFVRGWQEVAHMQLDHPDIIKERLIRAGILDMSTRFTEEEN
jgi:hypothetical protein